MGEAGEVLEEIPEEDEEEEQEEEYQEEKLSPRRPLEKNPACTCNQRIDELAMPHKRMFLALWNEHAHHLPQEKVKRLKELLKQLYAMTPEETAKYFAELRAEGRAAAKRKRLKQKLRKHILEQYNIKQRERAIRLFKKILSCGIHYAVDNPVPPLISIRLRYLSDIILEHLCSMTCVEEVPNRNSKDLRGKFLIRVSDWMAIAVERLYYAAQLTIKEMIDRDRDEFEDSGSAYPEETFNYDQTKTRRVSAPRGSFGEPVATSTPRTSFGEPVAASTPRSSFGQPIASSTPRRSVQNREPDREKEQWSYIHEENYPSPPEPYYSIIESETAVAASKKKTQSELTRSKIKDIPLPDRSHIEIPHNFTRGVKVKRVNVTKLSRASSKDTTTSSKKAAHEDATRNFF